MRLKTVTVKSQIPGVHMKGGVFIKFHSHSYFDSLGNLF